MGIEHFNLPAIIKANQAVKHKETLLFVGYPNFFLTKSDLERFFPNVYLPEWPITPQSFGKILGYKAVKTIDFDDRADESIDLTTTVPDSMVEKYDFVIDVGVAFWCFSPGVAIKNMALCVAPHGSIVHIAALTGHIGRGYYNIHPKAFYDFYQKNGFKVVESMITSKYYYPKFMEKFRIIVIIAKILGYRTKSFSCGPESLFFGKQKMGRLILKSKQGKIDRLISGNVVGTYSFHRMKLQSIHMPIFTTQL